MDRFESEFHETFSLSLSETNFPFEWASALRLKRSENCCFNYLFAGLVLKKHFTLFPAANYPDYDSSGRNRMSERTIRHENWYLIVLLYFTIKSKNFYVCIEGRNKTISTGKKIPCNDDGIWFDNKIYKRIKRMLLSMLLLGKFVEVEI